MADVLPFSVPARNDTLAPVGSKGLRGDTGTVRRAHRGVFMARSFPWLNFLSLWLFAGCLGLMEAAVVVYLRALGSPGGSELAQLHELLRSVDLRLLWVEEQREVASIVLLLVPAYLFSERFPYRLLAYVLCFGVWDLTYYAFLRGFIAWPQHLMVLDVLFLIPRPWIAPVLCPVLLAAGMVVFASAYLFLARTRAIKSPHPGAWSALVAGVALVLYAFMGQTGAYQRATEQLPLFAWWWFSAGYALLLVAAGSMLIQLYREPKARFF
jgi:hypothetical protein